MQKPLVNIAYIDAANLYRGVTSQEWQLNYSRFISWLRHKYGVTTVYVFIGYLSRHEGFYNLLKQAGYKIIFKEVVYDGAGRIKGNCDVELTIQATRDCFELPIAQVILVSSDGDFVSLVKFWQEKRIKLAIISPARIDKCSLLLRKINVPLLCLDEVKDKICS